VILRGTIGANWFAGELGSDNNTGLHGLHWAITITFDGGAGDPSITTAGYANA
jgi:hypothetical protein